MATLPMQSSALAMHTTTLAMQTPGLPVTSHTTEEALNLCVRSKSSNPVYSYDYNSNRTSPPYYDPPVKFTSMCSPVPSVSDTSETQDSRRQHTPDPLRGSPLPVSPRDKTKATRPFKAFPKNPMPFVLTNGDPILDQESADAYLKFRNHMLTQLQSQNSGTNKNMRRLSQSAQGSCSVDPTYWEKRRKNNEAAKRSRDARRAKEDEIAIRCAFLEQENIRLKLKLSTLEDQMKHLLYR